jgi:hypothetical protein
MSKKKRVIRFKEGDRVAEKPKATFMSTISKDKLDIVAKNCTQRYGVVIKRIDKKNATGIISPYYQVKWDNNSIGDHAQCRLCFETELPQILEDYTNKLYGN